MDNGFENKNNLNGFSDGTENVSEDAVIKSTDETKNDDETIVDDAVTDKSDFSDNDDLFDGTYEQAENGESEAVPDVSSAHFEESDNAEHTLPDGAHTYSKANPDNDDEYIKGCVWNGSSSGKLKKSSNGFKVFVGCMLTVFTLAVVAVASFMIYDFTTQARAENSQNVYGNGNSGYQSSANGVTTLISTFKDVEGEMTKSEVALKCSPSTVGIVVEVHNNSSQIFDFGYFGNYFSVPQITQGVGSGFIYNEEGYIITNHHVVDGAQRITVYFNDKTTLEAELVGADALSDIAVIKVDAEGKTLIPMEIGDSDKLVVGNEVVAIGCPAGIEYMGTVTDGIISAINRDVQLANDGSSTKKTMTLLQTNATINKGNSGGPLINTKGEVIGINTLKLGSSYEGIGFSIPINGALPIIAQLIEYGEVKERSENDFVSSEGIIGISASNISEADAEYYDIPLGVLVVQIDKNSSAAKAGLRRGDIITAYNGTTVKTLNELNGLKSANKAGDEVTLSVYRDADGGQTVEITFKLDAAY